MNLETLPFVAFTIILAASLLAGHYIHTRKFRYATEGSMALVLGTAVTGTLFISWKLIMQQPLPRRTVTSLELPDSVFFRVLLPPIIFYAGWSIKKRMFFRNFGVLSLVRAAHRTFMPLDCFIQKSVQADCVIMVFGFFGTLTSAAVITAASAATLHTLGLTAGPRQLLEISLALGAICSCSDTVGILQILDKQAYPQLYSIVFGEGIVNDAVAVVLLSAVGSRSSSGSGGGGSSGDTGEPVVLQLLQLLFSFTELFGLSLLLGVGMGLASALLVRHVFRPQPDCDREVLLLGLLGYLSYLLADAADLSAILSVFFCGLSMSHYTWHSLSPSAQALSLHSFRILSGLMEMILYAYAGIHVWTSALWQKPSPDTRLHLQHATSLASVLLLCIVVARLAFVYPVSALLSAARLTPSSPGHQRGTAASSNTASLLDTAAHTPHHSITVPLLSQSTNQEWQLQGLRIEETQQQQQHQHQHQQHQQRQVTLQEKAEEQQQQLLELQCSLQQLSVRRRISALDASVIVWGGLSRGAISLALAYHHFSPSRQSQHRLSPDDQQVVVMAVVYVVLLSTVILGVVTGPLMDYIMRRHKQKQLQRHHAQEQQQLGQSCGLTTDQHSFQGAVNHGLSAPLLRDDQQGLLQTTPSTHPEPTAAAAAAASSSQTGTSPFQRLANALSEASDQRAASSDDLRASMSAGAAGAANDMQSSRHVTRTLSLDESVDTQPLEAWQQERHVRAQQKQQQQLRQRASSSGSQSTPIPASRDSSFGTYLAFVRQGQETTGSSVLSPLAAAATAEGARHTATAAAATAAASAVSFGSGALADGRRVSFGGVPVVPAASGAVRAGLDAAAVAAGTHVEQEQPEQEQEQQSGYEVNEAPFALSGWTLHRLWRQFDVRYMQPVFGGREVARRTSTPVGFEHYGVGA